MRGGAWPMDVASFLRPGRTRRSGGSLAMRHEGATA